VDVQLDSLIFQTEAEVRWLDLCEARLVQQAQSAGPARKTSNGVTEDAAPLNIDGDGERPGPAHLTAGRHRIAVRALGN
jgi:hypothetical protein